MCLVESQDICLVETQDMCCVGSLDKPESQARPAVSGDRRSKENLCEIEALDQKPVFSFYV